MNLKIREAFNNELKEYRILLKSKQKSFQNDKLTKLSETDVHSQSFWNILKTVPETFDKESTLPVQQNEWLEHFGNLHSSPRVINRKQHIIDKLKTMESESTHKPHKLDFAVSIQELKIASKNLKNKKACYSDLLKNEMIKVSCEQLTNVYLKLFNLILKTGIFPNLWCEGIITPIFKSGDKTKSENYRGICVSSCIGKLFTSILNRRLMDFIHSNNLLHPSQIGFLNKNRTSDHIFTLRTLIEKYAHLHKQKIYACFVDYKKAFDSVWHEGLFFRLLDYGIGGNIYSLIKSLYTKSSCAIKLNKNRTEFFQYQRGVRQGCIMSPSLFNPYF